MEVRESGRLYTRQGGSTQLQQAAMSSDPVRMVPQMAAQDDDLAGPAAQSGHGRNRAGDSGRLGGQQGDPAEVHYGSTTLVPLISRMTIW